MKAERIVEFLGALGCERIRVKASGVSASCPLAPWNHSGGRDRHSSFYVYIQNSDVSRCGCLAAACGYKGDLKQLVYKIQKKLGRDMSRLIWFVHENDQVDIGKRLKRLEDGNSFYAVKPRTEPGEPIVWTGGKDYSDPLIAATSAAALPKAEVEYVSRMIGWLDAEAMSYLRGPTRRFTDETIKKWKLGWHPGANRISVPQYDHIGRLVNISGRHLPYWPECIPLSEWESKAPKWMHSNGFHRELYLFGEDNFQLSGDGRGTVFLTEGGFDVVYLDQCGIPNPAAINGSHINTIQIEKVLRWFDHVVLVMDGDEGGIEAANKLEKIFAARTRVSKYVIADGRDPNQLIEEEVDELKKRFVY